LGERKIPRIRGIKGIRFRDWGLLDGGLADAEVARVDSWKIE
jgi:hypothetical protein